MKLPERLKSIVVYLVYFILHWSIYSIAQIKYTDKYNFLVDKQIELLFKAATDYFLIPHAITAR